VLALIIAAAASEPEASERGSRLIFMYMYIYIYIYIYIYDDKLGCGCGTHKNIIKVTSC
jgi:hypothetical protein